MDGVKHLFSRTEVRLVSDGGQPIPMQVLHAGDGPGAAAYAPGVSARLSPFVEAAVVPIGLHAHDRFNVHCRLHAGDPANWAHLAGGLLLVFLGGPAAGALLRWFQSSRWRRAGGGSPAFACGVGMCLAMAYVLALMVPFAAMRRVYDLRVCSDDVELAHAAGDDGRRPEPRFLDGEGDAQAPP